MAKQRITWNDDVEIYFPYDQSKFNVPMEDMQPEESDYMPNSVAPTQFKRTTKKCWSKSNKCHICGINMRKLVIGEKRHHCRWCGQTVCNTHSLH